MEILLVAAFVFLMCWLLDKGFTKLFRGKPQHQSGRSVRLNKHYGGFGVVLFALGVSCLLASIQGGMMLLLGGVLLVLIGVALTVYYMSFGIYYDEECFLISTFGRKSETYRYADISSQQLFANGPQTIIELYMTNGRAVQLLSTMTDVYTFMDHAFAAWLIQTGRTRESCTFHDPANSCWFPKPEDL